jgi:ATP-dependent Clp protease ATP-binding subunit ClpA
MVLAQEAARLSGAPHISTVHMLIGIATESEGLGHDVLLEAGITPGRLQAGLTSSEGPASGGGIPFTAEAKQALELSVREAVRHGTGAITTGHLLLALLTPGLPDIEAVIAPLTDVDALRRTTIRRLADNPTALLAREGTPGQPTAPLPVALRDAILELADAVHRLGDNAPDDIAADVTSALDRVRALLADPGSVAPIGQMIHHVPLGPGRPRGPAWTHNANRQVRHLAMQLPSWARSLSYWIQNRLQKPGGGPTDRP